MFGNPKVVLYTPEDELNGVKNIKAENVFDALLYSACSSPTLQFITHRLPSGVSSKSAASDLCTPEGIFAHYLFSPTLSALAANVSLHQGYCCSVADKYIEYECVLIAIDLALHRIQAYRHLLFNRRPFSTHTFLVRSFVPPFVFGESSMH